MTRPLADVVARASVLLLDFDGPVCAIFGGYRARDIAKELRTLITAHDGSLDAEIRDSTDPIQVLQIIGAFGDETLTQLVADRLRDAEVTAATTAPLTPDLGQDHGS